MAQTKQIEKAHKIADIYDRLNNQQNLQEIISKYVLELLYAEDREIWLTKHKKNHDLLTIEWELFVEVEMNEDWRKSFGVEDYYIFIYIYILLLEPLTLPASVSLEWRA